MTKQEKSLTDLQQNQKARILFIHGGKGFRHKLSIMGITEGKTITVITKQPFRGPLTIKINGTHMTIGRGMAQKIMVEVIP